MRNQILLFLTLFIMPIPLVQADRIVDLSGSWIFNPVASRSLSPTHIGARKGPAMSPQEADPGIGWPRVVGPDGKMVRRNQDAHRETPIFQGRDLTLIINQTDRDIHITRKYKEGGQDKQIVQRFSFGGSQNSNPASSGHGVFVSSSSWENNSFIVLGKQTDDTYQMIVKEKYSLSKGGKRLTIKTSVFYLQGKTPPQSSMAVPSRKADATFTQVFDKI